MSSHSLSRETIRLMMQGQRMVQKEFGIRIPLHEEQAVAMLIAYGAQSSQEALRECSTQLIKQLAPGSAPQAEQAKAATETSAKRIYRGQQIETTARTETTKPSTSSSGSTQRNPVIYRGRAVG